MTEAERQFREAGWYQKPSNDWKWYHAEYGVLVFKLDIQEHMMDMWLTGFVAGKESVSPAGEISG